MSEQLSFAAALEPAPEPAREARPDAPPPTPEQRAAIEARDRDVFLEAGAGTGKTRVLVDRYCDAVDLDGVDPERILAFTFTERAAAEMRRRVRVELGRRGEGASDAERRERLLSAARAGESAPITTIHGFCRRLLASHPVAAGIDPRFRVLDAEEASRLGSEAYESALAALGGGDDADPAVIRAAAGYRYRLAGIIRAAHSDLRNRGAGRPELPPLQFSAIERGGSAEAGSPAEIEHASAAYDALSRLLVAFADRYEELCARRSGVDFDHLQLFALSLLRERRAIAEAQRERFDHLLVDEFQDTSPIQVELVRSLAGPRTRLFAVGDEFQSIYAFRGADLASFRRERERIRARAAASPESAAVLPLSGSFRSDPDVVAAVNAVGAALLDDFAPLRVGRVRPEPPAGPAGPAVELLLTRAKGWGDADEGTRIKSARQDASQNRVAEARFLAERLRELADDGVDAGGMVVLLRAFTNVDVYAEALELAGLDPHVIGGRGYWSAQQVADALGLLACVANPLDDQPLLGALASPACGASPDALWMLRRIAGRGRHLWPALEGLFVTRDQQPGDEGEPDELEIERRREAAEWAERIPAADRERLGRFHERLTGLRERAPLLPLDTLVETTLETFDYDLTTLLADDGRKRTANLRKLVRIATEYEAHDGRDLRGFLDHAAARAAFSDREAEAATLAEEHSGVRVMTVHAAKGLEFETVAVADLGRPLCVGGQPPELRLDFDVEATAAAAAEGPPPARVGLRLARAGGTSIDTEGYAALNEDAADAEAEESGRLVYVAASRAERRLILSGVFKEKDLEDSEKPRRQRTALACLLPALGITDEGEESVEASPPAPREGLDAAFAPATIAVRVIGASADSVVRLSRDRRRPSRPDAAAHHGRPPLIGLAEGGAAAARGLSYAALTDYGRCGYRFLVERVIGLGGDAVAAIPESHGGSTDHDPIAPPARARHSRMGFGRAVHELLEWCARNDWTAPPDELVEASLTREGAGAPEAGRAHEAIAGWLSSPLLAELRDEGARFRPEVPFRVELGAGTVLRGTIDLLATGARSAPDIPTVVDFKTDRLAGGSVGDLDAAYALQRDLYAAAVADATGVSAVRSAYVFLEQPDQPIVATLDAACDRGGSRADRGGGRRHPRRALRGHLPPAPRPLPRLPGPRAPLPPREGAHRARRAASRGRAVSRSARIGVFAYGSLVSARSAADTLGGEPVAVRPAELRGWRRGFTQARLNRAGEKTFARRDTGEVPEWILGLAVEPEPEGWVNGALIELDEEQASRLDLRELRYERRDVTEAILADAGATLDRVFTYVARAEHRAPEPPPGAVILRAYAEATEAAFGHLGPGELARYRDSTWIPPVEVVEGVLIRDEIPPGNPRSW